MAFAAETSGPATLDPAVMLTRLGEKMPLRLTSHGAERVLTGGGTTTALPLVEREPYLHLIIDRSEIGGFEGRLDQAVSDLMRRFPKARRARVTYANYEIVDVSRELRPLAEIAKSDASRRIAPLPLAGSCALDLAVAHALRQHLEFDLEGPGSEV